MRRCIPGLCVLLVGCIDVPGPNTSCDPADPDRDGDGWRCDGRVPDCDDLERTINPGAFDRPDNGADEDCSGADRPLSPALDEVKEIPSPRSIVSTELTVTFDTGGSLLPTAVIDNATGIALTLDHGLGARIAPAFDSADAEGFQRTFPMLGPGVADAEIDWRITGPPTFLGHTHLVVRADSTVIRQDTVSLGAPGLGDPGGPYDAGTVLALDPARFDRLRYSANPGTDPVILPATPPIAWQGDNSTSTWICLVTKPPERSLSVTSLPVLGLGPSLTADTSLTIGYDWERAATTVAPGASVATQILQLTTGQCGNEVNRVTDMAEPLPIDMIVGDIDTGSAGDSDHDGYDEGNGWYTMTSNDPYLEFVPPVGQDPIAVRFDFSGGARTDHGITVWKGGNRLQAGVDYLFQLLGTSDGLLWLATSFATSEPIRIASPGGEP